MLSVGLVHGGQKSSLLQQVDSRLEQLNHAGPRALGLFEKALVRASPQANGGGLDNGHVGSLQIYLHPK